MEIPFCRVVIGAFIPSAALIVHFLCSGSAAPNRKCTPDAAPAGAGGSQWFRGMSDHSCIILQLLKFHHLFAKTFAK
jgi:hypothetical protein